MQSALCLQSTLMHTMCSVAARYLPHSTLNLRHAETTNSGSQFQAVEEKFSEESDILEQSVCRVADGAHKMSPPTPAQILSVKRTRYARSRIS
jgi:hypothetical protein